MLDFSPNDRDRETNVVQLFHSIEHNRGRKLICFHQGRGNHPSRHSFNDDALDRLTKILKEIGRQENLSILLESPGGDIDCAFRMVRILRHYATDVEILVSRYAKSAATFLCLAANTIYLGRDAELGPLDAQLPDPRGSIKTHSALNTFKSLEYLRQYVLETLDQVVLTLMAHGGMDIPFAVEAARPLVADIVTPLYQQVDPHELGEARRYLSIGEEYCKMVMERYSYRNLSKKEIQKIVDKLVWGYPSHGFVIDLQEAKQIGLNVKPLDQKTADLCCELVSKVDYCYGFPTNATMALDPNRRPSKARNEERDNFRRKRAKRG